MKKRILIIVYALLLCVTASFAWISNFDQSRVESVMFNYNNGALTVWNNNFEGKLMVPIVEGTNADGTPKEIWKDVDKNKGAFGAPFNIRRSILIDSQQIRLNIYKSNKVFQWKVHFFLTCSPSRIAC